jgi:hypothetical protein
MKIDKNELKKALEIVKPGLANKEMIEQSTSFAFIGGHVVTYNDEISIRHPTPYIEFKGAIQAEELYQLIGKIKPNEMDIEISETEILIKSGRTKAGLALQQEIKLPLDEITEATNWFKLPKNFIEGLKFVSPSCSTDMSTAILTCVNITKNNCQASDRYQIAEFQFSKPTKLECLLPASSAQVVIKLNPKFYSLSSGWVHFKTEEETILSCRILEDKFPDVTKFFKFEGDAIEFPQSISNILDRASVFSKRQTVIDEMVTIFLSKNKIKIKAVSETGSWIEEPAKIVYKGGDMQFDVTPSLLTGILSQSNTCTKSATFIRFESENWRFLAALRD